MTDKKRITIDCWNCRRQYSWLATFDGSIELFIACPFCGAEAVVRLAPWAAPAYHIYAGDKPPLTLELLNLPAVLPSEPRPAAEE